MRNVGAVQVLACAITALLPSCRPQPATPPAGRPNVLFVSIDTLRADYLGAYGGTAAATFTLDGLAAGGVLFEHAVAHVPMTLPSHASMFTSLIPPSHGVRDNGTFVLDDGYETLAEVLRASGYRTGAFVGAFVLDARFGLDQGFDVYDDDVEGTAENDRPADAVLDAARRWIVAAGDDRPWFAFVHLFDPHAPYQAPPPFDDSYRNAPYAGEVSYVDDALGRFLGRVDALDDTLIVVTADHGEGLGEHGERTHGMFGYDSTLHVPLVFHWPKALPRGLRVPTRVRHIDVAPTIAELAGADPPASFHGRSLTRLIAGDVEADRDSYFESFTYAFNYGLAPLRGLYHEGHKLVSLPIPELYDLVADPDETRNLATGRAGTVRAMTTRLSELVATEVDSTRTTAPIDQATRERLESLGYLSSGNRLSSLDEYGPADDPKNWVHLANMLDEAVAHHRARRPAEAMQLLRAIIAEKDDVAIAHTRLARILHEEGRSAEAIEVLEEALARGIDNANVVSALGALLREEGDEAEWSRVLEGVVARSPDDSDAHQALAASLMRQGLPGRAVPHLERFIELDPTRYDTLVELGLVLAELGRESEARHYLERFVTTAPDTTYRQEKEQVRAFVDALGSN